MYTGLLHSHNGLRWLVLVFLVVSLVMALVGWFGKKERSKANSISGMLLVVFMDLQFLTGIILYAFVSPITKAAFANFGEAMKNPDIRFYAVEHIFMMVIALVLVHIGRAKWKKASAPWKGHRTAAIFYGISLLLILAAIPWDRAMF